LLDDFRNIRRLPFAFLLFSIGIGMLKLRCFC